MAKLTISNNVPSRIAELIAKDFIPSTTIAHICELNEEEDSDDSFIPVLELDVQIGDSFKPVVYRGLDKIILGICTYARKYFDDASLIRIYNLGFLHGYGIGYNNGYIHGLEENQESGEPIPEKQ